MGKGFDTFMENPYWRGIFDNAPSQGLRDYYRIMFDASPFVEHDDADAVDTSTLEDIMLDRRDVEYLMEHAGMPQARGFYARCIRAIDEGGEGTCVFASSCRGEVRNPWYTPEGAV